jgi:hypothetical protein
LRRNFFAPLSFETIFISAFFALQCGMHVWPGSHREKSIAAVVTCPPIEFLLTARLKNADTTRKTP